MKLRPFSTRKVGKQRIGERQFGAVSLCRFSTFRAENGRSFTPFTSESDENGRVRGKLAEGSDKLAPRIGFWAQDLDNKNFLRLRPLRERKFQDKKPKSFVRLLREKWPVIRK